MPLTGPAELLARRVAADPARPLVTFYDDATGERVELSAKTFDNWVAKTANLLVDGLGAQPGDRAVLALPQHWQSAAWLFACWSAGVVAEMTEPSRATGPYLLVASEEVLPTVLDDPDADEIVGLSLHALGGPLKDCPPGVLDYAVEVRGYGDRFVSYAPVGPDAPALRVMAGTHVTFTTFSAPDLVREAAAAAEKWGLDAHSRVLVHMPFDTLDGILAGLLAPLTVGGSVIIQRNLDNDALDRRLSLEHVTAVAGVTGSDQPSESVRRLF